MRKIISKQEDKKKEKRNQIIVGVALLFLMLTSAIAYSLNNASETSSQTITYNGMKFTKKDNVWNLQKGDYTFYFFYSPRETQELNVSLVLGVNSSLNLLNKYSNKPIYISSSINEVNAEIYQNLVNTGIVTRMQYACLNGTECNGDYPIKTCEDNFIIVREANSSSIKQEGNCVTIEGKTEDLLKTTDEFLFRVLEIKK